jgi:hypothetical protein
LRNGTGGVERSTIGRSLPASKHFAIKDHIAATAIDADDIAIR